MQQAEDLIRNPSWLDEMSDACAGDSSEAFGREFPGRAEEEDKTEEAGCSPDYAASAIWVAGRRR